jgi:hypothetical protein
VKELIDENDISNELYVYYLQLEKTIDSSYIMLAAHLKEYGIELVPVHCHELDYFLRDGKIPVIAMTDSLEKDNTFKKYRREYLDFALRSNKIMVFHLNSFGHNDSLYSEEKKGAYIPMPLPMRIEDISLKMVEAFFSKRTNEKRWPGGNRSTLPEFKK